MKHDLRLLDFFIFSILNELQGLPDICSVIDIYSELAVVLQAHGHGDKAESLLNEARVIALAAPDPNALRELEYVINELSSTPTPNYSEIIKDKKNAWIAAGGKLGNSRYKNGHIEMPYLQSTTSEYFEAIENGNLNLVQQILGRVEASKMTSFKPYDQSLADLAADKLNAVTELSDLLKPWPEDRDAFCDDIALRYFESGQYESAYKVLRMITDPVSKSWSLCRCLILMLASIASNQVEKKNG